MELTNLKEYLEQNSYPGRGILLGKTADSNYAAIAYFIMGRSENSRNRIFEEDLNDGIRTQAYDETKLLDPSLVIYAPVLTIDNCTIVTNGDQTDTIYEYMGDGATFEEALHTRTFEPDPPIFTPRISGIVELDDNNGFSYKLSILKSNRLNEASALRFFYEYETPVAGEGHLIHTYQADGNPPQSFSGEPRTVEINGSLDEFTKLIWDALNEEKKVSLFTRFINLKTGEIESRIVNKHKL